MSYYIWSTNIKIASCVIQNTFFKYTDPLKGGNKTLATKKARNFVINRAVVSHQRRTLDLRVSTFSIVEFFLFTNFVLFVG